MSQLAPHQTPTARNVRAMYNAYPFPNRIAVPPIKSDERYRAIYQEFLHIPLAALEDKNFLDIVHFARLIACSSQAVI